MNKFNPTLALATLLVGTCVYAVNPSTQNYANLQVNVEQTSTPGDLKAPHADYNHFQRNEVMQGTTDHRVLPKPAATDQAEAAANEKLTVVEIAVQNPSLQTLVQALKAADLTAVLERQGPYTIFAPNDAAFNKLSKETLDNLLKSENKEKLRDLLKYHVLPGTVLEADVKADTVFTLNGKPLKITINGKEVLVNDAKIVKTDIKGSNGVIHIIDTVLVPKN